PVEDEAEAAQLEARVLQVEQFGGGQVDGDLLVVSFPAGRRTFICGGWLAGVRQGGIAPLPREHFPGVSVPCLPPPLEDLLGEFTVGTSPHRGRIERRNGLTCNGSVWEAHGA